MSNKKLEVIYEQLWTKTALFNSLNNKFVVFLILLKIECIMFGKLLQKTKVC